MIRFKLNPSKIILGLKALLQTREVVPIGVSPRLVISTVAPSPDTSRSKISVVGTGQVGMACAFSLLTTNVVNHLSLCDVSHDKLKGEMLDLQHASAFLDNVVLHADTDFQVTSNSKICVVTAGARQETGETRLDLVQKNADIFKIIIPQLLKHSPHALFLIVSNPCDVLTYVAWKLSGLPPNRVFGSGTNLDSARFRFLLSQRLGVEMANCHGWIIGEHGDTSVPLWSNVRVGGVRLIHVNPAIGTPDDKGNLADLHKKVINSAYEVIQLKGYTSWAIGLSVAQICEAVLHKGNNVYPVSTLANGHHGIDKDVFLSLPCLLNENGISDVVKQRLTSSEKQELQKSANLLYEVQTTLTV